MTEFVPLSEARLDEIVAIEREAFAGRQPWSRAAFAAELLHPQSLWRVAVEDEAVTGYGGGWITGAEWHLLNLATRPDRLRRGIARALLTELLRLAAGLGANRATLEVRPDNLPAVRLYESLGFIEFGVRPAFYPDGSAARLMARSG